MEAIRRCVSSLSVLAVLLQLVPSPNSAIVFVLAACLPSDRLTRKPKTKKKVASLTAPKSKKLVTIHNKARELNPNQEDWERVNFRSIKTTLTEQKKNT